MSFIRPDYFDFKAPDYVNILADRAEFLARIRADTSGQALPDLKAFYAENPAQFISDWGMTVDPRNPERGLPTVIPFILFDKQVEFMEQVLESWRTQSSLIVEKSRDMGISWCAVALAATLCLFKRGFAVGFGSRKAEYVDKLGDPKSLFYKARMFLNYLPIEFRGGWDVRKNTKEMQIDFPSTGSVIAGESGDDIGRGDRKSIYFVDEAAHLERPQLADASLSATTNCRIDMSSVMGMANPFAEKRHSGKYKVFTFHWRDDPRKDDAWYQRQIDKLDIVVVRQEIDINYTASVDNLVLSSAWIQAAVDAHIKLGIKPTGAKRLAFDVADQGRDKNAVAEAHGVVITNLESWSGNKQLGDREWDISDSVQKVFEYCDARNLPGFSYDADGLGASVRGDARKINEQRSEEAARNRRQPRLLNVTAFRGSASGEALFQPDAYVLGPDGKPLDRTNKDFFANHKAQCWWNLRYRFQHTYAAICGKPYDPDMIISISSEFAERARLLVELSQPVYLINGAGKILIDKTPEGVASPNLADAVMMVFAPRPGILVIPEALFGALSSAY